MRFAYALVMAGKREGIAMVLARKELNLGLMREKMPVKIFTGPDKDNAARSDQCLASDSAKPKPKIQRSDLSDQASLQYPRAP